MSPKSKRELAEALRARYRRAGRVERGRMLDQFCAATGYHRVYARRVLVRPEPVPSGHRRPGRPKRYGSVEVELLRLCWVVADRICGKRLAPFLGELLNKLAACELLPPEAIPAVQERVSGMSAATIDRLLVDDRLR